MWKFWKKKRKQDRRFEGVRIIKMEDGTIIEGHEAIEAHFTREQALVDAHGQTITFQLYRLDLRATSMADFQGPRLAELRVEGSWVSGTDTVATVKDRVRTQLPKDLVNPADEITFYFNRGPMSDDALFYADHFMSLPSWVQVLAHDGVSSSIEETIRRLSKPSAGAP